MPPTEAARCATRSQPNPDRFSAASGKVDALTAPRRIIEGFWFTCAAAACGIFRSHSRSATFRDCPNMNATFFGDSSSRALHFGCSKTRTRAYEADGAKQRPCCTDCHDVLWGSSAPHKRQSDHLYIRGRPAGDFISGCKSRRSFVPLEFPLSQGRSRLRSGSYRGGSDFTPPRRALRKTCSRRARR
jgi:hypothetical protein